METKQNFSHEIKNYLSEFNSVIQLDENYNYISIYFDTEMASKLTCIPESTIVGAMLNREITIYGYYFIPCTYDPACDINKIPVLMINKLGLVHYAFKDLLSVGQSFSSSYKINQAIKSYGLDFAYGFYWKRLEVTKDITFTPNKQIYKFVYNTVTKTLYRDVDEASKLTSQSTEDIYEKIFKPTLLYNTNEWIYIRTTLSYNNLKELSNIEWAFTENSIYVNITDFQGIAPNNHVTNLMPPECKVKRHNKPFVPVGLRKYKRSLICMISTNDFSCIEKFSSGSEASRLTGITNIYSTLDVNKLKSKNATDIEGFRTAGGYIWMREPDYNKFIENQIQDML